jgi:hypothetical protein
MDAPLASGGVLVSDPAGLDDLRKHVTALAQRHGLDGEGAARLGEASFSLGGRLLSRAGAIGARVVSLPGQGTEVELTVGPRFMAPGVLLAELVGGITFVAGSGQVADEVDVDFRIQESATVRLRCLADSSHAAHVGHELAIVGRAVAGDSPSGDDAGWARRPDGWLAVVADGLGHGAAARQSSARAVSCVCEPDPTDLQAAVSAVEGALRGMRGVTLALVQWDQRRGQLSHLGVGDVSTLLVSPGKPGARRFVSTAGVLGGPRRIRPRLEEIAPLPGDVLVMATDGLRVQLDGAADRALLLRHPAAVATHLLSTQAVATDDALVLVVRFSGHRGLAQV